MKTKSLRKIKMLIVAGTMVFCQAEAQTQTTALSGSNATSNAGTSPAGNAGTDNTNVGFAADQNVNSNCKQNTIIGSQAGYSFAGYNSTFPALNNTFIGFTAGYSGTYTGTEGSEPQRMFNFI